jgi:hypothetical protein
MLFPWTSRISSWSRFDRIEFSGPKKRLLASFRSRSEVTCAIVSMLLLVRRLFDYER